MTLYLFDNLDSIGEREVEEMLPMLSAQRREKVLAYRPLLSRKLSAVAGVLLGKALRDWGISQVPEVAVGEHGKPFLPGVEGVHFNLSHCREAVACVIADRPVGVDVECYREVKPSLARYVLSEEEQERVGEDPREFARIWTMKEALVKCLGTGIQGNIKTILAEYPQARFHTELRERYAISVCTMGMRQ